MSLSVRDAAGLSEIGEVWVRDGSGLSQVAEIWVRDASGLSQVFGSFKLVASPDTASGSTSSHGSPQITTNAVSVTPNPPGAATYAWTFSDGGWSALNSSSPTTAFRSPPVAAGDEITTTATCTATRGTATASVDVPVQVDNFGF